MITQKDKKPEQKQENFRKDRPIFTFTLVKRIGIAFFLRSYFFGFTQTFRIFGHAFVCNR